MPGIFDLIIEGDAAAVADLIERDPAAAYQRDAQGISAVMSAVYRGKREILALLLSHAGAGLDIFEAAAVGLEPRLTEVIAGDAHAVHAFSTDGFTPLHLAAYFGHEGAARSLLAHGADAGAVARNDMRVTPLHSAVSSGQHRIAGELIAAGADVNARQQGGYVPLHGAAMNGDLATVELLLASGADPAAARHDGRLAAGYAREAGHADVAARLENAGPWRGLSLP